MRKLSYLLLVLAGIMLIASCSNTETYADQKKKERSAINSFIADSSINVISEKTFFAQDSTTDVSKTSMCSLRVPVYICKSYVKVVVRN